MGGFDGTPELFRANAEALSAAFTALNLPPFPVEGGYFLIVDVRASGKGDFEFCEWLLAECGVAALPMSMFTAPGSTLGAHYVRLAVCKKRETIAAAVERLARLAAFPAEEA